MMLVVLLMALASPNPSSLDAPRNAYATCIKSFEKQSLAAKVEPAAYSAAIKDACTIEAAALATALVAYDVAMGDKRATAAANAASDVADYVLTSEERYVTQHAASKPK